MTTTDPLAMRTGSGATLPLVLAEQVTKKFGNHQVLSGIDFSVEAGEVACIIGPSGSGKSTFLRCLNALEKPDGGRIRIDGADVGFNYRNGKFHEWNSRDYAKFRLNVGMVFQRFNLFANMTALENVACGPARVKGEPKKLALARAEEPSNAWGWPGTGTSTR